MKTTLKYIAATAVAVAASAAMAAEPVASVSDMSGLVTVSQGNSMANAVKGTQLVPGSVVATSASSSAVIRYKQGCDVKLEANQSLKINDSNPCGAAAAAGGTDHVAAAAGVAAGILLLPVLNDSSGK